MGEKYLIPVSIIIAGLLVAIGVFWTKEANQPETINNPEAAGSFRQQTISIVDPKIDHILGDAEEAEMFIVEYSDLECPYCKTYHNETFLPLSEKYAEEKVAFVFRHFPLDKSIAGQEPLHPTAGEQARASECAAEQGGDEKFYEYLDKVFYETKSDGKFPLHRLPLIAEETKLDKEEFISCLAREDIAARVEASYQEAIAAGLNGTPTVFIQIKNSGKNFEMVIEHDVLDQAISEFLN